MSKVLYEVEYFEKDSTSTPCHKFFEDLYSTCDFASLVNAKSFRTYHLAGTQYLASGSTLI